MRRKGDSLKAHNPSQAPTDQWSYRISLPLESPTTVQKGIAGDRSGYKDVLLKSDVAASGNCKDQDHKLDTPKCHTWREDTRSRRSPYLNGGPRAIVKAPREVCTPFTTLHKFNRCKGLKQNGFNLSLLRDLTATARGRSLHTSGRVERLQRDAKEDSLGKEPKDQSPPVRKKDSKFPRHEVHSVRKSDSLVTLTKKELLLYKDRRGAYNGLINILRKPEFLVACYEEIKGKPGNMTRGIKKETLDGLDMKWIERIGNELSKGKYNFSPARRVLIPKSNGKTRPLGISSPREKIVQKALAVILEQIWEDKFCDTSHGFRPKRSVHSALREIYLHGNNHTWVIQGDITKCFDSIPHGIIMKRITKVIKCQRTQELIKKTLSAGYVDPDSGKLVRSDTGTPQGSILSPLLSNIVLHELDTFIEKLKQKFDRGKNRSRNTIYMALHNKRFHSKDRTIRKQLLQKMRAIPTTNPLDPNFRRMMYVRYADDFVVLVTGTRSEAELIKMKIGGRLRDNCGLELNTEKTIISRIDEGFHFLGAHCKKVVNKTFMRENKNKQKKRVTTKLLMHLDAKKIFQKLKKAHVVKLDDWGIPHGTANDAMTNFDHADIVNFYNSKARGLVAFYSFAGNRSKLIYILWILKSSCALTLAKKYKLRTQGAAFKRFGKHLECPETGTIFIEYGKLNAIHDYKSRGKSTPESLDFLSTTWASKLTESNIGKTCAICSTSTNIEMHHIRTVKDIRQKVKTGDSTFDEWRGGFRRKQIPLCKYHHELYHSGKLNHPDLRLLSNFTEAGNKTRRDRTNAQRAKKQNP